MGLNEFPTQTCQACGCSASHSEEGTRKRVALVLGWLGQRGRERSHEMEPLVVWVVAGSPRPTGAPVTDVLTSVDV